MEQQCKHLTANMAWFRIHYKKKTMLNNIKMSTLNLANMLYLQYINKTIEFSSACNRTLFCFPILVGTDCLQTVSICALLLLRYPNPFHIIDGVTFSFFVNNFLSFGG